MQQTALEPVLVVLDASGGALGLSVENQTRAFGRLRAIEQTAEQAPLDAFDAVLMRKDPPFDSEFFYTTQLLSQAEREGARVFNKPAALRDHPEKLAA